MIHAGTITADKLMLPAGFKLHIPNGTGTRCFYCARALRHDKNGCCVGCGGTQ